MAIEIDIIEKFAYIGRRNGMNNVLELKGKRFEQAAKTGGGGGAAMNSKITVTSEHILRLIERLNQLKNFWQNENQPFNGALISVHYNKIVAKTNRIAGIFKGEKSNYAIVGAKFNSDKTKHIITYFLDLSDIDKSIALLYKTENVLRLYFEGVISKEIFDNCKTFDSIDYKELNLSKSLLRRIIADVSYIEDFDVELANKHDKESIITIYDTGVDIKKIFKSIGIDILSARVLDNRTVYLDVNQLNLLYEKAPYLVAMSTENLSELSPEDFIDRYEEQQVTIPAPEYEPVIGVIDTLFDERVYFGEWVEYHQMIDDRLPVSSDDYRHGTAVSSIMVDGPKLMDVGGSGSDILVWQLVPNSLHSEL